MNKISVIFLILISIISQVYSQNNIPKMGYAVEWVYPRANTNPPIPKFDKIELGINLHDSVTNQINNFIQDKTGSTYLNPFNPQDIDIYAEFNHASLGKKKKINAFFFEDFKRDTSSSNMEDWNWVINPEKIKSRTKFRIRFSPNILGNWSFKVYIKIKNKQVATLGDYNFTCVESKKHGFVKIASNKRYLELDGKTYLPIGQNIPKPSCFFEKDAKGIIINDPYKCSKCPCAGVEEWCPHLKKLPMNPKVYLVYLEELKKFKESGGNYFRMINFPHTYEIEYDHLGNYYSRLNVAWELDKMFDKANELDLKVHFNLFLGYPFTNAQYGVDVWDWYSNNENDKGYCYANELNLKEPAQFLTDPEAKKYFKYRLRYMIARWGYSTSIAVLELVSEINNKFRDNPKEIYLWQKEMTQYIKEELGHDEHLLTINYDNGRPNKKGGDESYSIPYLDIITHNIHRATIFRSGLQDAYKLYSAHNKPMIFSEVGTGDTELERCDNHTEWLKDLWATIFSGTATAGINWNLNHDYNIWKNFKHVENYTKDIDFNNFLDLENQKSKNQLVELLALHDYKNQQSIGMIDNITWNYFSIGNGGTCKTVNVPKEKFQIFQDQKPTSKKTKIQIKGFQSKKEYQVFWYDPFKGNLISSNTVSSTSSGKIQLEYPALTKDLPFVVYKLTEKGKEFHKEIGAEEKSFMKKPESKLEVK